MRHHILFRTLARRRAALVAALGLLLAACASKTPAPIVPRTQPSAQRPAEPARAPAPPSAATAPKPPAPAPAPAPPEATVQTAPVRIGSIESRGLETRPLDPRTGAPAATPPAAAAPPGAAPPAAAPALPALPPNAKTGPRGAKVPYTDSALAELRAAESAPAAAAPSAAAAAAALPSPAAPSAAPPAAAARAPDARPAEPTEPRVAEGGDGDWAWPASGKLIQTFTESGNKGVVLGGRVGDPVLAAADGRVIFSGNGPRGYGNLVIVKHANELLSVYAHNRSLAVKEGQSVKRGQKIAELGDSGTSSPRLHFEIRQQGKPVDPARFLPRR
jgi:lipoprotein NlpD